MVKGWAFTQLSWCPLTTPQGQLTLSGTAATAWRKIRALIWWRGNWYRGVYSPAGARWLTDSSWTVGHWSHSLNLPPLLKQATQISLKEEWLTPKLQEAGRVPGTNKVKPLRANIKGIIDGLPWAKADSAYETSALGAQLITFCYAYWQLLSAHVLLSWCVWIISKIQHYYYANYCHKTCHK